MALDAQCGDFPRVIVLATPSNTSRGTRQQAPSFILWATWGASLNFIVEAVENPFFRRKKASVSRRVLRRAEFFS